MSEKGKTGITSRMNVTAVVVSHIIFELYRILIKKIQIKKMMLKMIMVALQQTMMPFSKRKCRSCCSGSRITGFLLICPHVRIDKMAKKETESKGEHSNHMKQEK
jgi:hypothetical protein